MVSETDRIRFARIVRENMLASHDATGGIGTLGEKRMHAMLKDFLGDRSQQEIPVSRLAGGGDTSGAGAGGAKYVADLLVGDTIFEVQTGGFYPLKKKLVYYLSQTSCHVTVVHPMTAVRYLTWIDPGTGELSRPRRSPRKQTVRDIAGELYWLKPFVSSGRLTLRLLFCEIREYRYRNGWSRDGKRGAQRYERIPTALCDDVTLSSPEDYARYFLPEGLPDCFGASEYEAATGIRGMSTYSMLALLTELGLLTYLGKSGRRKLWGRAGNAEGRAQDIARENPIAPSPPTR